MQIASISIGGKPVYHPPRNVAGVNRFVMRTGASRFGKGAFAMLRRDYDQLVADTGGLGGRTTLVMNGLPGPGLTMAVVLAAAEPLTKEVSLDKSADLMKVTVYDRRCQNFTPLNKFYNVVQDGYPLDNSNKPICYASTLTSGSTYGWDDVLGVLLGSSDNVPNSVPTWTPYNLIWDNIPICRAIDDAAAQLFYVVGFDHQAALTDSAIFFPPYKSAIGVETQDTGFAANFDLLNQIDQKKCLLSGALPGSDRATERNNKRLPGQISVVFPGAGGGGDPYDSHRNYTNTQSTGFGLSDYTVVLNVGNMSAVWSGSAWLNQSDLDAVATDLAPRAAVWMSQVAGQAEYAGIWPFRPDGRIRQVEWSIYPEDHPQKGARTVISTDNGRDWSPDDSLDDPINLPVNQRDVGLGSATSAIGTGGINYASSEPPSGWFRIIATATPGGLYTANPFGPPTTQPNHSATSFAYSDLGISANQTVYLQNVREIGTTNHILDPTSGPPLLFWGGFKCIADDGKPIYLFDGCQ